MLITFTLVKRIRIAFFLRSLFFGFTQSFRIFAHDFVYNRQKGNIFKVFWYSVTIFVLFFVKLIQHIWFGVYQIYAQHIYWANLVQKFNIVSLSWNLARKLTQICRIRWLCSLFLLQTGNTLFRQIWSKNIHCTKSEVFH